MKFTAIKFRTLVPHPAIANGGYSQARDEFRAPDADLETVGSFVRVTVDGKARLVNLNQVLWCDELVGEQPKQVQQQGKRK